jgi:hypothetical protein
MALRRPWLFDSQSFGNRFRRDAELWRDTRCDVIECGFVGSCAVKDEAVEDFEVGVGHESVQGGGVDPGEDAGYDEAGY